MNMTHTHTQTHTQTHHHHQQRLPFTIIVMEPLCVEDMDLDGISPVHQY